MIRAARTHRRTLIAAILAAALAITAVVLATSLMRRALHLDEADRRPKDALLYWREGDTRVWLEFNGSFDMTLELHVDSAGSHRFDYVIDKSSYGTLRLVRDRGRILVTADRFIFAAYDPATDEIIRYDHLPFTIWERRGEVLDTRRFGDEAAYMRRDFPHHTEGKSTATTTAPTE